MSVQGFTLQLELMRAAYLCQVDRVSEPQKIKLEAEKRDDVVCISALNGNGLLEFCDAVQNKLKVLSKH